MHRDKTEAHQYIDIYNNIVILQLDVPNLTFNFAQKSINSLRYMADGFKFYLPVDCVTEDVNEKKCHVAEKYYEIQSWRYPHEYRDKDLKKFDYAALKIKQPSPFDVYMPVTAPCAHSLLGSCKAKSLDICGFPLKNNYQSLEIYGKRFLLQQYGMAREDRIISIDSQSSIINYAISTLGGQSGAAVAWKIRSQPYTVQARRRNLMLEGLLTMICSAKFKLGQNSSKQTLIRNRFGYAHKPIKLCLFRKKNLSFHNIFIVYIFGMKALNYYGMRPKLSYILLSLVLRGNAAAKIVSTREMVKALEQYSYSQAQNKHHKFPPTTSNNKHQYSHRSLILQLRLQSYNINNVLLTQGQTWMQKQEIVVVRQFALGDDWHIMIISGPFSGKFQDVFALQHLYLPILNSHTRCFVKFITNI